MESEEDIVQRLIREQHLVVDGRIKRDVEVAEHVRRVAHRLIEQRGIANRLAWDLVEKRRQQHAYYHGRGAELWTEWIERHPEHANDREPEPELLTLEDAIPLVMAEAESQVWEEAHQIGCNEYEGRQRRELDSLWMFIHDAEATPPAPDQSKEDRALARRLRELARPTLPRPFDAGTATRPR